MADAPLRPRIRELRERAGLSQAALAEAVGVSRQTWIAVEAGRQVPSALHALKIARALGSSVEQLFELPPEPGLPVTLAPLARSTGSAVSASRRVAVARVGAAWVAHPLAHDAVAAADGILATRAGAAARWLVEPLVDLGRLERHVLVAGCAPLLGILAACATRERPDLRVSWLEADNRRALDLLAGGLVHAAGLHGARSLADRQLPVLRRRFAGRRLLAVNLTRWRQGLVVAPGNPLGIHEPSDVLRRDLRFAWRAPGAGATQLLETALSRSGVKRARLPGGPFAAGHLQVAQWVRAGAADVGVAIEGVALGAGLDFVPLAEERFDLVVPEDFARQGPVAEMLELLAGSRFRDEAATLPGYDGSLTGDSVQLGPV